MSEAAVSFGTFRLESVLGDFKTPVESLGDRAAGPAPGSGASIQKLEYQRERGNLVRRLNWVAGIALALGGAAVLIVWRRG